MNILRGMLLAITVLGLAACATGYRSTGTGGTSATPPTTSQAGASDSMQIEPNTGVGAP